MEQACIFPLDNGESQFANDLQMWCWWTLTFESVVACSVTTQSPMVAIC